MRKQPNRTVARHGGRAGVRFLAMLAAICIGGVPAVAWADNGTSVDAVMAKQVVKTLPYQTTSQGGCNAAICRVDFDRVEKNRRLRLDSVGCRITVNGAGEIEYAGLQTDREDVDLFVPQFYANGESSRRFAFSHRTNVTIQPKTEFWIEVRANTYEPADTVA